MCIQVILLILIYRNNNIINNKGQSASGTQAVYLVVHVEIDPEEGGKGDIALLVLSHHLDHLFRHALYRRIVDIYNGVNDNTIYNPPPRSWDPGLGGDTSRSRGSREGSDAYSVGGQAVVLERADEVVLLDAGRLVLVQMLEYL